MKGTVLTIFYVLVSVSSVKLSVDFEVTHWTKCPRSCNFMKFVGISVGQCVDECTRRQSCKSVGYRRRFNLCEVHLEDVTPEDNTDGGSCIFIRKDDMLKNKAAVKSGSMEGHVCDVSTGHCHKECNSFTLKNGKVFGNRRHAGAKVAFACDDGFREEKEETNAICNNNGKWSYSPICKPLDVKLQSTIVLATTTTTSPGKTTISPVITATSLDKTATTTEHFSTSAAALSLGTTTISPATATISSGLTGTLSLGTSTISQSTTTMTSSGTTESLSLGTTTISPSTTAMTSSAATRTFSLGTTTISPGTTALTGSLFLGTTTTPSGTTNNPLETMKVSPEQQQTVQTLATVSPETKWSSTEIASATPKVTEVGESTSGNILTSQSRTEYGNRTVVKKLSANNGGKWGSWRNAEFCPEGSYASGYDMKIDPYTGKWLDDDTALNGIKLFCESQDGQLVHRITSDVGPLGDWVGPVSCTHLNGSKFFLTAFDLQVQPGQGASEDDTAANFVRFKCRDRSGKFPSYELAKDPGRGEFGSYGTWSEECFSGQAICGLKTKIEKPYLGDDSALNDVIFYCCH